ncbi:orotidine-5'-phosphate decarboxylase [Arthrobacter agilis]|uniref:orotidine-5'-phosphate decarboxylase n=1 Tax=Arthrobacter agilis TaxID=37921 RepID=UPI000B364867|nr:orotidine-5'-phosphate decarboxylase [Arthrobacter agilis]OUM45237.1 orotidine-5'-phosphate decarboxylase [Arthrobacter agilis]PPB47499.1 orotidine-5'-phosphate decarboxylase [Arthrobacter agilis]TPV21723.1 orotidine-5'-phosphate decarboxylase [Arthrobacter agilis]VDR32172.1 orotidine 5'-phosphate decarboxylase [Arthrobacter agilis]
MPPEAAPRAPFGERLAAVRAARGSLCVGIDPHPALLAAWGLEDSPAGLERFSLAVLDAVGPVSAALKPQVALYERHGARGLAVLETLLSRARDAGVLTIADAKRGDIGSTMQAYADAWLGEDRPLAADAVTLNPYLGFESLRPAIDLARETGRGVFVLALTSNAEGQLVQHVGGDSSVARSIAHAAAAENRRAGGAGHVGLVVGATIGDAAHRLGLDLAALNGPILAPGVGAQGAGTAELRAAFGDALPFVLPTSSRAILAAGPGAAELRAAAERTRDELA